MTYAAPGKLFTTGAWAILEGAPAVILAVDRYALATHGTSTRPEVRAVADDIAVDVIALERDGRKLGLGSSAAAAVAAAAQALESCDRERVLERALAAHRSVQPHGSGGDVAASTFGGVVVVRPDGDALDVRRTSLPAGVVWRALALPRSARTSDAITRWQGRRAESRRAMQRFHQAAESGVDAITRGSATAWLQAASIHVEGLSMLSLALDLPLLPPELAAARLLLDAGIMNASAKEVVLMPSGAGGGDTVLWLGARAPTDHEVASLASVGLELLDLALDTHGVHQMLERN